MSLLTLCCCSHYESSSGTAAALLPLESCDNNCACGLSVYVCAVGKTLHESEKERSHENRVFTTVSMAV